MFHVSTFVSQQKQLVTLLPLTTMKMTFLEPGRRVDSVATGAKPVAVFPTAVAVFLTAVNPAM